VCWSLAWRESSGKIDSSLLDREQGDVTVLGLLTDPQATLAIHNAAFDLGCFAAEDPGRLPAIFDAYAAGRVRCTIVRQMLIDVALGMRKFRHTDDGAAKKATYGLDDLVELYFGERVEKEGTWRLKYGLLDGIPISEWPEDAHAYAIGDAEWHLKLFEAQEKEMLEHFDGPLPNEAEQQRAAWALHLMGMWGLRADAEYVDRFVSHCEEEVAKMRAALAGTGILKDDGSRTMAEIRRRVVESLTRRGLQVPRTDPSGRFPDGQVQTDKEALESTDDPALHVLAESMTFAKHLSQWGPVCRAAVLRPVCARYNPLVETGRTACSGGVGQEGTNFQNPPRRGDVRPCFVARPGYVFCFSDADVIELRAHAQNCLDLGIQDVRLAEIFWEQHKSGGPDPHETLAAQLIGVPALELQARVRVNDPEATDARQFAKIPNYGFPGGLGAQTFVGYAAAQLDKEAFLRWFGATHEEQHDKSRRIRETWFATMPENREYFRIVGDMMGEDGEGTITQCMSGRVRGGVRFTAASNGFFQGRVADAMKDVLWYLADECYTGRCATKHRHGGSALCTHSGASILRGSRPCLFLHDEPGLEHPEDGTEGDRAARQEQLMMDCLNRWMPQIPCTSSAVLVRRWFKGAKPVKINGKLVPSRPQKGADGKTTWVHDTGAS
jgi:hypothetical protein